MWSFIICFAVGTGFCKCAPTDADRDKKYRRYVCTARFPHSTAMDVDKPFRLFITQCHVFLWLPFGSSVIWSYFVALKASIYVGCVCERLGYECALLIRVNTESRIARAFSVKDAFGLRIWRVHAIAFVFECATRALATMKLRRVIFRPNKYKNNFQMTVNVMLVAWATPNWCENRVRSFIVSLIHEQRIV